MVQEFRLTWNWSPMMNDQLHSFVFQPIQVTKNNQVPAKLMMFIPNERLNIFLPNFAF